MPLHTDIRLLLDKGIIVALASCSDTAVSLDGTRAGTAETSRPVPGRKRHRGEVLHMTAVGLQSTAPQYPLIQLFRGHRTVISAAVGLTTFAALAVAPAAASGRMWSRERPARRLAWRPR